MIKWERWTGGTYGGWQSSDGHFTLEKRLNTLPYNETWWVLKDVLHPNETKGEAGRDYTSIRDAKQDAQTIFDDEDKTVHEWVDSFLAEAACCATCGTECSTHADAAEPLDYCPNCSAATCTIHRDECGRCPKCVPRPQPK